MHLAAFFLGLLVFYIVHKIKTGGFDKLAQEIISKAQQEAEAKEAALLLDLKEREFVFQQKMEQKTLKEREKIERREEKLDRQLELVEKKLTEIDKKERLLKTVEEQHKILEAELERISAFTCEEARSELKKKIAAEMQQENAKLILRMRKEAEEEAETEAAHIISTAINRLAIPTISEVSVITVALPNQEMKGRVIGREGRNIRALEQATGVTFTVDDTPNAIVISGFDPVRKEIAKKALKELIQEGRIHPTRIEEVVAKMEKRVQNDIKRYGEDAALRASVIGLHPELLKLLGQLKFRFSHGQNVLEHSLEVSYLMGIMAAELGIDSALAKRIGLLHDIGKAVSMEIDGSHALIGRDFALRFGESEEVANGIGCHHNEISPITIEGSLCSAADTLSAGRPGARVEALQQYLKRIERLEQISTLFEGVEHAYALQAGREIRVIVEPNHFDDASMVLLARDIAKKIEDELIYPGKIKVTVIREKRAVEYAT